MREVKYRTYLLVVGGLFGLGFLVGSGVSLLRRSEAVGMVEVGAGEVAVPTAVAGVTPTPKSVVIKAVGDVMTGRSVNEGGMRRNNFFWPFEETDEWLVDADLTVGNLETPIVTDCVQAENRFIFCAASPSAQAVAQAGFDVMSLANNHSLNQGKDGLAETVELLSRQGVAGVRPRQVEVVEKNGIRFGFMGLDDVSSVLPLDEVETEVAEAAKTVDVLVGIIHWGVEYTHEPGARQKEVAHRLVKAGMKLIIGAHPHWTQPVERYEDGLIFYSLGNFVFDQMWSMETRQGEVAEIEVVVREGGYGFEYEVLPVLIYDYGQPRFVGEIEARS